MPITCSKASLVNSENHADTYLVRTQVGFVPCTIPWSQYLDTDAQVGYQGHQYTAKVETCHIPFTP